MHITTHSFSLAAALEAMPFLPGLLTWHAENHPSDAGAAFVVPADELPTALGVDDELLLLVLRAELEPLLLALGRSELGVYNWDSDDLLSKDTCLALETEATMVQFDAGIGFPGQARCFYLGLVAGKSFVLARHELGEDEEEAFFGGLQGARGSSGANYRPYRVWSEAELRAAAQGLFVPGDGSRRNRRRRFYCGTVRKVGS